MFIAVIVAVLVIPSGEVTVKARLGTFSSEQKCLAFARKYARLTQQRGWEVESIGCLPGQRI